MTIQHLDHVNLRTGQLGRLVDWYGDVLGLRPGPRPEFPFEGTWLYAEDLAMVHIISVDHDPGSNLKTDLTLEHFAFRATDAVNFEAKLRARGEEFRRVDLPEINTAAFNLRDPDGNHIHVDFLLDEVD